MPSRFDQGTVGTGYSSIHSADAFVGDYQVHCPRRAAILLLTPYPGHVHAGQFTPKPTTPEKIDTL